MRYKPFTFLSSIKGLQGCISASGGQEIIVGDFKYHIFTGSASTLTTESFVVHSNPCSDLLTVLSVARGGNGGNLTGSGAGGGVETSSFTPTTGSFTMALFVSGTFGSGDSIAFSGSGFQVIAQRGGDGATNTVTSSNGGGGNSVNISGSTNIYGYSGSNFNAGGANDLGAGAGVGGNAITRSGDSSIGGIGIFIPEFAPLDGQFSQIYYGGYPAGFYGGGGGGRTSGQLGESQEGGGGRNKFPNPFDAGVDALNANGVDFVGGGGMGGNPSPLSGNGSGGQGAIYIRYLA